MKPLTPPLLVLIVLTLAALACGSSPVTPSVIATAPAGGNPPPTPTLVQLTTYNSGEVIQVKDHTIVLNSAQVSNGILTANFTVENNSPSNISISSLLSFNAKDNNGAKLEGEYFDCGSSMDGTVLAGDKLNGNLCWKVTGAAPYKIYYESEAFNSSSIVVWSVSP